MTVTLRYRGHGPVETSLIYPLKTGGSASPSFRRGHRGHRVGALTIGILWHQTLETILKIKYHIDEIMM
jgi:hypothetical protein